MCAVHVLGAFLQHVRRAVRRVGGGGEDVRGGMVRVLSGHRYLGGGYAKRVRAILRGAPRGREEVLGTDVVVLLVLPVCFVVVVPDHVHLSDVVEVLVGGVAARAGGHAQRGDGLHRRIRRSPLVVRVLIILVNILVDILTIVIPRRDILGGRDGVVLVSMFLPLGALRRLDLRDGRGDLRVLTVSRLPFLPLLLLLQGQVERLHDHQVLHVQVPRRHERLVRRVVQ